MVSGQDLKIPVNSLLSSVCVICVLGFVCGPMAQIQ